MTRKPSSPSGRRRRPVQKLPADADLAAVEAAHAKVLRAIGRATADSPVRLELEGARPNAAALQLLVSARASHKAGAPVELGPRAQAVLAELGVQETA